jgi:hypothetical protein
MLARTVLGLLAKASSKIYRTRDVGNYVCGTLQALAVADYITIPQYRKLNHCTCCPGQDSTLGAW